MRTPCLRLLALLAACAPLHAAEAPFPILPVSQVRPGMQGYGLSVFHGTAIERFDVEVIDVLPKADIDGDWIMIRMTSGPVAERNTGVVKGMSGSPVYIDDKLVGAVAYGYAAPTENVAFLTPIESMLRVFEASHEPAPPGRLASRTVALRRPVEIAGTMREAVRILDGPAPDGYSAGPDTMVAEPLMTPMTLSGLGPRGLQAVSETLAPYRLAAMSGPTGGQRSGTVDLQPGAAVGVALVTGDVTATSTGTVTARIGDRVLCFGHPMLQRNRVALPLTGAYVVDIWASRTASSKVTAALDPLGTLIEDGHWGVVGQVGPLPKTIPMRLSIRDLDRGTSKTIQCAIADDDLLAPSLAVGICQGIVADWLGLLPRSTVTARLRAGLADQAPVEREEVATLEGGVEQAAITDLLATAQLALNNPYGRLPLTSIELDVEVKREDDGAVIERAYVDKATVEPGDDLKVELDIRRRRDDAILRHSLTIHVPENAAPGKTRVAIAGGLGEPGMAGQLKLLVPPAQNTDQLVAQFRGLDTRNRSIVAKLALPSADLSIRGERFPNPPTHFANTQGQAGTTDLAAGQAEVRVEVPFDLVILNGASAPVSIAAPGAPEGAPAEQPKAAEVLPGLPVTRGGAAEALLAPPRWAAESLPLVEFEMPLIGSRIRRPARELEPEAQLGAQAAQPSQAANQPQGEGPKPPPPVNSRDPRVWVQNSAADFSGATLLGTAVDPDGGVLLSVSSESLGTLPEPVIGAAAVAGDGSVYLASGNNGELYRLAGGQVEAVCRVDRPILTAVAVAGDRVLFASAPDGVLHRLVDGRAEKVAETGAAYVWKLLPEPDGTVLVATGEPAGVWRLAGDSLTPLWRGGSGHILSLALAPDGAIYAGGSPNGLILRLHGEAASQPIRAADEVNALAVGPDGTLYYGSGGQVGTLQPDGRHRLSPPLGGPAILDLLPTDAGLLVAVRAAGDPGKAALWQLDPIAGNGRRLFEAEALVLGGLVRQGEDLLAWCSDPARIYRLRAPHGADGSYESRVLDAQLVSAWGAFEMGTRLPQGAGVAVETRSGNTAQPGDDWSAWAPVTRRVNSPSARYLQYRLKLTAGAGRSPIVDWLRFHYSARNLPPSVSVEAPALGTAWRGKQEIAWKASDPNGDQPMITVLVRRAGTEAWQPVAVEVPAGQGKVPFETDKLEDGLYELRLIADDGMYNPDDPQVDDVACDPFLIDNTAPEIQLAPPDGFRLVAGRIETTFTAHDALRLGGAEWRFDGGPWRPAAAADGLFDSDTETVRLRTGRLTPGEHVLEIRVRDAAGNEVIAKHGINLVPPPAEGQPAA